MYTLKNGETLNIERAQCKDAAALIEYLNTVGAESDNLLFGAEGIGLSLEDEEKYIESMQKSDTSALFVGSVGDEIVTVGSVTTSRWQRIVHHGEVALSVKKSHWGIGLGRCMMQKIIDFSRLNNTSEMLNLGVRADNMPAINLYKKMGFVEIGRFEKFFKVDGDYYDEILMLLKL